jgi:hypothetical protein
VLIGRAAGVPTRHVFPLGNYLRVFALASVAGALGYGVKRLLPVHAALLLSAEIVTVLGTFMLLGTLTKTIARSDWAFVRDWLKLKH